MNHNVQHIYLKSFNSNGAAYLNSMKGKINTQKITLFNDIICLVPPLLIGFGFSSGQFGP